MKYILLALLILLIATRFTFAEEMERVPKYKSFEIGYRYLPSTSFNMPSQGTTVLFDYAWQLSGFTGRPAGYISVPLGYTYFPGEGNITSILSYGWTVRHDLKAQGETRPFFGYGLLLNQLRTEGVDGSSFGHQTRFDFGYIFKANQRWSPFVKLEYSYTRYPHLGEAESDKIHAIEIKGGLRF